MSRVGKTPLQVPDKVTVSVDGTTVKVQGPRGKTAFRINPRMKVVVAGAEVKVSRPDDTRLSRGLHGLTRTLVKNAILGVTRGYERSLEISGVGFKAEVKGREIHLVLGFSHPVVYQLPEGVTAEVDAKQTRVILRSADKHLLGLTAAAVRALRPPEPYKDKGIKYAEEVVRRKEGKTGAA